jgi:hypothetical protein
MYASWQRELISLFGLRRRFSAVQSQSAERSPGGLDGDASARAMIEEQDRLIAEKSGVPAIAVKSVYRSRSQKHPPK